MLVILKVSACDHLAFRGESVDWQLWVDRGEKPFFRKIVLTYKELPGEPQLSARLSEWDIEPSFSDTLFQFSVPEGARRIQVLGSKRSNPQKRGDNDKSAYTHTDIYTFSPVSVYPLSYG